MRHVHSPAFDALESRKLLTKAHPAVVAPPVSLVLGGTLAVDNKASYQTVDTVGDTTTTRPVAGVLGSLGKVRGVWNQSVDSFGDALEPDTLQLNDPHGTFVIAFNPTDPGKVRRIGHGTITYEVAQHVRSGTRAYARASETGTIELISNTAQTAVAKLTLSTRNT
jgi:hypothetical protein